MPDVPLDWQGLQSMLSGAGVGAQRVEGLWWLMCWVFAAIWLAVVGAALGALRRRRAAPRADAPRRAARAVVAATAGTVLVLLVTFGASLAAGLALARLGQPGMARIEITGHRWWWEVRYLDERPERIFTSANELHLPAGRPVELVLRSADVIHSFWAPRLHGKIDLIPGRTNRLVLQAQEAGVHRAQCAEFCGVQHAKMALMVVVRPPDEHARWLASQLAPLAKPADELAREGRAVFERHCAACHAMRGTAAGGRLGPDLTRFAQRLTVGAGTLPNTPGHRAGWIADPQHVKPGSLMPWVPLQGRELQAVLRYLEAAV